MKKLKVGILGATGMVGQRFVSLLHDHPWFSLEMLAASPSSAGKKYGGLVSGRWTQVGPVPKSVKDITVLAVEDDFEELSKLDVVFSALNMDKNDIQAIEEKYAGAGVAVVSNNSAHRWTEDVPMLMPEINGYHAELIEVQRKNRGWDTGLIAVKPNCSIQSYVSILTALEEFGPQKVHVTSLQAISGAGKTFETWPEMQDNVIPFIGGEEEKSEKEPLRIWGDVQGGKIVASDLPEIEATCVRVAVTDGHMAVCSVDFEQSPSLEEFVEAIERFNETHQLVDLHLPSSPKKLITILEGDDRPQTHSDRDIEGGMGISIGRIRPGEQYDWNFVALSHNTLRGAAGGAVLMAEYLYKERYIQAR